MPDSNEKSTIIQSRIDLIAGVRRKIGALAIARKLNRSNIHFRLAGYWYGIIEKCVQACPSESSSVCFLYELLHSPGGSYNVVLAPKDWERVKGMSDAFQLGVKGLMLLSFIQSSMRGTDLPQGMDAFTMKVSAVFERLLASPLSAGADEIQTLREALKKVENEKGELKKLYDAERVLRKKAEKELNNKYK